MGAIHSRPKLNEVTQMTPDVYVWISKWDEMSGSGVTVDSTVLRPVKKEEN